MLPLPFRAHCEPYWLRRAYKAVLRLAQHAGQLQSAPEGVRDYTALS